jgi:hypothetical protein
VGQERGPMAMGETTTNPRLEKKLFFKRQKNESLLLLLPSFYLVLSRKRLIKVVIKNVQQR